MALQILCIVLSCVLINMWPPPVKLMWLWILIDCHFSHTFWVLNMSVNISAWAGKEGQQNFRLNHHTGHLFQASCYCVENTDVKFNDTNKVNNKLGAGIQAFGIPIKHISLHNRVFFLCSAHVTSCSSVSLFPIYIIPRHMCSYMAYV